ncbi:MAG: hypothetical protein AAF799_06690 [Myxococcota bacterium]
MLRRDLDTAGMAECRFPPFPLLAPSLLACLALGCPGPKDGPGKGDAGKATKAEGKGKAGDAKAGDAKSGDAKAGSTKAGAAEGLGATAAASTRTMTFTNQCGFDLWLDSVGSNASMLPCTPSDANAQGNCAADFICYNKNAATNYCVPGTTTAKTFPVSDPTDITLDASQCKSGAVETDTKSDQWGQCTCSTNGDCPANQICGPAGTTNQCYWGYQFSNDGKVDAKGGTTTLSIDLSVTDASAIVASGKFFAKSACTVSGNCLSDNTQGAPATLIEYTFQNDNDWYDVSYINGMNAPAAMYPTPATNLDYESDDPYRCMVAGGDSGTIGKVTTFQSQNGIKGNDDLSTFACANDYSTTFASDDSGYNAVYSDPGDNAPSCSKDADCSSASTGSTCGLTVATVKAGSTQTTCGDRIGYWNYAQFCAANSTYANASLNIACNDAKTLAYAECVNQTSISDQGPGRSCFNANTTVKNDTCCGFENWTFDGNAMPMAPGDAAVDGVDTTYWTTNILPVLKPIKEGCPLAYAFQFDDPFSTFTCATTGGGQNTTDYEITFCAAGDAGIDPPTATCTASVPKGFTAANFTVGVPSGITLTIDRCDGSGSCTTPVNPTTGDAIFTATSGDGDNYQITADKGGTKQVCTFSIPTSGCIGRVTDSSQCSRWSLPTDGDWAGRNIAIADFN